MYGVSCIHSYILHHLQLYYELTPWPALSWLTSSDGSALHRYRRGHFMPGSNPVQAWIFQAFKISQLLKSCINYDDQLCLHTLLGYLTQSQRSLRNDVDSLGNRFCSTCYSNFCRGNFFLIIDSVRIFTYSCWQVFVSSPHLIQRSLYKLQTKRFQNPLQKRHFRGNHILWW